MHGWLENNILHIRVENVQPKVESMIDAALKTRTHYKKQTYIFNLLFEHKVSDTQFVKVYWKWYGKKY